MIRIGKCAAAVVLSFFAFASQVAAQTPAASFDPPAEQFVGESFCTTISVTNASGPTGYGPYVRLTLPPDAPAGAPEVVQLAGATFLGGAVAITDVGLFDGGGNITDPVTGTPVSGPPGARLLILQPPVGSVTTGTPPLDIEACFDLAADAAIGVPLDLSVQPYFRYGDTPTGDNGPIFGATVTDQIVPTIARFRKDNDAPEHERPPGAAFPYTYSLIVDIADGATIYDLDIGDTLPVSLQYIGPVSITGGSGCVVDTEPSTVTPGGALSVLCDSATGGAGDSDVVVSFDVHVVDILDETTCGTQLIQNAGSFATNYSAPGGNCGTTPAQCVALPVLNDTSDVTAKHIALQKGAAPAGVSPGTTVTYTIDFQVTQFGNGSAFVLTDTMPDGVAFDAHGSLTVGGAPVAITPTVTPNPDGTTTIVYDIGAVAALPSTTTGTITYTGVVEQNYQNGDTVVADDPLTNVVTGDYALGEGAAACSDGSGATVVVDPVVIEKSIISAGTEYTPGDVVTFRLSMTVPSGDTDAIVFRDYFPLPVFDVADIDLTFGNDIRLAPTDDVGATPTSITVDPATSELAITWPDIVSTTPRTLAVDVDVTVVDTPFADDLFLTNLLEVSTANTQGATAVAATPVFLTVRAPELTITKGVIAIDNPAAVISPPPATLPSDGDVTNADAGDAVSFRITVENIGGAEAYDVTVTDTLPAGLTGCAVSSVTDGTGAALATTSTDLFGTGLVISNANPLAANDESPAGGGAPYGADTAIVEFTCGIDPGVTPGAVLNNNAQATHTSQPGATPFPPVIDDSTTITIAQPSVTKSFVASSEAATSDAATPPRLTVGEIGRYRLTMQVPEGFSQALTLRDALPSGLQFLDDGTATVAYVSNGGLSGGPSAGALPDAAISSTADCTSDTDTYGDGTDVYFCLGDVTNADSDADAEQVIVEFNALVRNVSGNQSGTNRDNAAQARVAGVDAGTVSNNQRVTIAEPAIAALNKTATPNNGDAGDALSYTISFANGTGANVSTAYDLVLTDTLPAGITIGTVTDITPAGGTTGVVDSIVGNTLTVTVAAMPPGGSLSVTFSATVDATVAPGASLVNDVDLVWSSLPGAGTAGNPTGSTTPGASGTATGERDGSGGINDYAAGDTAPFQVAGVTLDKVALSTSEPSTGAGQGVAGDADLTIGELVIYHITATLPEGSIPEVVIADNVESGADGTLAIISGTVFAQGANLTPTNPFPAGTISDAAGSDGIADRIVFDFGATTNTADGAVTEADRIVVEVVAQVIDVADNANADRLDNVGSVQYGSGLNATDTATIDVVEPLLDVQKSADVSTGDAGDIVTYTVTVTHTAASRAEAFEVDVTDVLPAGMAYVPGSLLDVGTLAPDVIGESGGTITVSWNMIPRGQSGAFEFQAEILPTASPGLTIENLASLGWESLPGGDPGARAYTDDDTAPVTVSDPGLGKVVFDTSEADTASDRFDPAVPDLTIGEEATYRVTVTFPEGVTDAATFVDQLPTGTVSLGVVSSRVVSVGANLSGPGLPAVNAPGTPSDGADGDTANDRVEWTLGDVTNAPDGVADTADQMVFEVVARVLDAAVNQGDGSVVDQVNTGSLTFDDPVNPGTPRTLSGTASIDVVEPELTLDKTPFPDPSPGLLLADAGDTLTFRLSVAHAPSSSAQAQNVAVVDTLPVDVSFQSATVIAGCAGFDAVADVSVAGNVVTFDIGTLAAGAICTIDYTVLVGNTVVPGASYQNTADLTWTSTADPLAPDARDGLDSDSAEFTITAPTLVKTAADTTLTDTGSGQGDPSLFDLAIGETVDYSLTVVLPEGTTPGVVIVDTLPAGLTPIGGNIVSLGDGGNMSTTLPGTPVIAGQDVSFDFGDVVNAPSAAPLSDQIVLSVTARVDDLPANVDGAVLTNVASFDFTGNPGAPLTDDADIELVEPALTIDKTMGSLTAGTVTVGIELENTGTAPAYDVLISDVLDSAQWNLASIAPGSIPAGFEFTVLTDTPMMGQSTVTLRTSPSAVLPDGSVPVGVARVFTFTAALAETAVAPVLNTAINEEASSLPDEDPNERDYGPIQDDASLDLPDLVVDKVDALLADAGGDGNASPGDTLRYTVTLTNAGGAPLNGITFADAPDANTVLVAGSVVTSQGAVTVGNTGGDTTVEVNVGALAATAMATITFDVTIVDPLPAGVEQVANQGIASSTELPDEPSDDPDTPDEDDPTVTPIVSAPDLTLVKDDGGATAAPGGVVTYTLDYANVGDQDATGVTLTDTVPANTSFVAASSTPGWSCVPDAGAGSVCTLAIGDLAAGDVGSASFAVMVDAGVPAGVTQIDNVATVADDGVNGADPTPADNTDGDDTPLDTVVDLTLAKDDGGLLAAPGDVVAYALTYANVGDQDAAGVTITETVPANTTFNAGASTAGWSCVPNGGAGATCTLAIGTVAAGAGDTVVFAVAIDNPLPTGVTQVANGASIADDGTGGPDPTPADNVADDDTPVEAVPNLQLVKDDGGVSVEPGGTVAYTLTWTNIGNQDATGVVVTDTVPANTSFDAAASTIGWTCVPDGGAGSVCTFAVGTVAGGGGTGSVTFAVTVDDPLAAGVLQIANAATVADDGSNGPDPTPDDNTGTDTTPVGAAPDLTLTKDDGGTTAAPGGTIAWTLSYANVGDQDATGVMITDTVPQHATFDAAASTAGWSCTPDGSAGSVCTLAVGDVAAGGNGAATFAVTVDAPLPTGVESIANAASIADDGNGGVDPTPDDNADDDTTPLDAAPDLTLTKDDGGASATPGGNAVYTLAYANVGNQDATGVTISETVPANTTFAAAASTAGWSCAPDGNAGSVCTLAVGDLAAGDNGSAVFAVTVDRPLPAGVTEVANGASVADDGSNGPDPTPADNADDDVTPIVSAPDLQVTKTDGGVGAEANDTVVYTIAYANVGDQDATGVVLTETVPEHTAFAPAASDAGWSCATPDAGSVCTLAVGDLAVDASGEAAFAVTVLDPIPNDVTVTTNTVTIADDGSNGADPTPADNTATDETPLAGYADLVVTKTAPERASPSDGPLEFTLVVENFGPGRARNVVLDDPTPEGLTFVSADAPCEAGFPCALGDMENGDSITVVARYGFNANAGEVSNVASVSSDTEDPNPDNDADVASVALGVSPNPAPALIPTLDPLRLACLALLTMLLGGFALRRR